MPNKPRGPIVTEEALAAMLREVIPSIKPERRTVRGIQAVMNRQGYGYPSANRLQKIIDKYNLLSLPATEYAAAGTIRLAVPVSHEAASMLQEGDDKATVQELLERMSRKMLLLADMGLDNLLKQYRSASGEITLNEPQVLQLADGGVHLAKALAEVRKAVGETSVAPQDPSGPLQAVSNPVLDRYGPAKLAELQKRLEHHRKEG